MPDLLKRVYRPRGAAREVFAARQSEVIVAGPAGTGKTRAILEKAHAFCLHTPGVRVLLLRKTLTSLTSTGIVTFREHVAVEALAMGIVKWYGGSSQEAAAYRYENGSVIVVGGMDRAEKVMSSEYDLIIVLEATELTLKDWEMCTTRLRNGRTKLQQILGDCNPDAPTHWIKVRSDEGKMHMLYGKHTDNPVLYNEDGSLTERGTVYMSRLSSLTGVRRARLLTGAWVAAEGVIYTEWDEGVNLVAKPKDPPHSWERYWTVDFGFIHPFVLQCWAIDPDGRAFMYRELYHSRRIVADHAKQILSLVTRADGTWKEPRPRQIICDHDAEDRATLERELGMATTAARKTVKDGIDAVKARMSPAGDGRPRLYIVRDATVEIDPELKEAGLPYSTQSEIPGYIWNETKDAPVKVGDDGSDAMRYLVAQLDVRPQVSFRRL